MSKTVQTIKVIDKEINVDGKPLKFILLKLGSDEGMTIPLLAATLNVHVTTVRDIIKLHGLEKQLLAPQDIRHLRAVGAIPTMGRIPSFLPNTTVRFVTKRVTTPEAEAINDQLWGIAESVHKGRLLPEQQKTVDAIVQAALAEAPGAKTPLLPLVEGRLVFTSEYLRTMATFMQEQEELIDAQQAQIKAAEDALHVQYNVTKLLSKRIESRDAEILDRQWYPLEYVKKEAPPAATISRECPHIWAEAMAFKKKYGKHRNGYEEMNDNGWVTQYLKVVHNVKSNIQELVPPPNAKDDKTGRYAAGESGRMVPRFLYNRADVTRVENILAGQLKNT